jgi:hypothetical protein
MQIANPIYDVVMKYLLEDKVLEEKDKILEKKDRVLAAQQRYIESLIQQLNQKK